jgi:hypothetical protein
MDASGTLSDQGTGAVTAVVKLGDATVESDERLGEPLKMVWQSGEAVLDGFSIDAVKPVTLVAYEEHSLCLPL